MTHMLNKRSLILAALVALTACGGESGTGPDATPASVVGVWHLRTLDGKPLPVTITPSEGRTGSLTTSETLTLAADSTFVDQFESMRTFDGQPVESTAGRFTGTWSQAENAEEGTVVMLAPENRPDIHTFLIYRVDGTSLTSLNLFYVKGFTR